MGIAWAIVVPIVRVKTLRLNSLFKSFGGRIFDFSF